MTLRLVTINFWGIEAPLDRRLALAIRQLRGLAPDVIAMQEVRPLDGASGRTTADELAAALGMHAHYEQAVSWQAGEHGALPAGQEGLALITRKPLRAVERLALPEPRPGDARILLSGEVDTHAGPIWVHTTHLHYRLDDGVARERQVAAVDAAIRLRRTDTSAPQLLCGDFNATPDSDEIRFLRGLHTLDGRRTHFQDAWMRAHGDARGTTWSSENELTRPLRSLDIDRRIDFIFVTSRKKDGRGTVKDCRIVLDERDAGLCASDHYGLQADIQIEAGQNPV
jgi:endonuclease/exonuclease/phosphatase family metal-dependent hydrolase|nr:endonuclease/exonuclease/phosphatase family protein [Kofleriaceae bacterium]